MAITVVMACIGCQKKPRRPADLPGAATRRSSEKPPGPGTVVPRAEGERPAIDRRALTAQTVIRPYEEWSLEETAADALGRIGEPAVGALVRLLNDPDPEGRRQAAEILARIGPPAAEAVPALIERLNDEADSVRKSAAHALGQIGTASAEAVPALMHILAAQRSPATASDRPLDATPTPRDTP